MKIIIIYQPLKESWFYYTVSKSIIWKTRNLDLWSTMVEQYKSFDQLFWLKRTKTNGENILKIF